MIRRTGFGRYSHSLKARATEKAGDAAVNKG